MKALAPHTPVIVGIGFEQERSRDPTQCAEAYMLMTRAVQRAARDAGSDEIFAQIESISIPQGLWHYRNPATLIAGALGCARAKTIVSDLGVLQLTLLDELCGAIAAGEREIGVITGGEAKYRDLCATFTGQPAAETHQIADTPPPDVHLKSSDPFCSELESKRGFASAMDCFAVIESALRHQERLGVEEHRNVLARLYSSFSEIAARNPHAWRREPLAPDAIRNPTAKNTMQAFPYTKLHCSNWNVNQAVALVVCSVAKAERLGLPTEGRIFPLACAQSRHVVVLAQKRRLHSHPGTVATAERAFALAGASRKDVTAAELYSCFPSAVRSFAHDLGLDATCPLTVSGAMSFAGGPFNHASLAGVARMVEVLRAESAAQAGAKRVGLVTNLSGIFGKQGCVLLSNVPNDSGYRSEDVTDAVAADDRPLPLDPDYTGPATIVGYTVVFDGTAMAHALAICDTPTGKRTVVRSEDQSLLASMTREEFCGRRVLVESDGRFSPA